MLGVKPASHTRMVGAVSAAHFVSHYYILLLAPLLPFVRADYGVSYTEIGLALAVFNTVSARLAGAGRILRRPPGRAHSADRCAHFRRLRLPGRGSDQFLLDAGGDVRARRHRQRGLPPGRLCAALATCAGRAHRAGVLVPHLRRHGRLGGGATHAADDANFVGLARRLHRRQRARLRGGGGADRDARPGRYPRGCAARQSGRRRRRLAAAADAGDPAQSRFLCAARDHQRRRLQLFGGRARRALCARR